MLIQGVNLIHQYLKCYQSLSDPKNSKQANRRLIQIQSSPQAWNIAQALIKHQSQNHQIHGCQLLSQKLNHPLPPQIQPNIITNFIYSQPNKTKLHWLCIAKCMLHMNSKTAMQLQSFSNDKERLLLLRQMGSAIIQTHTKQLIDIKYLLRQYYNANKQLLLINFDSHSDQVIEVLSSFLQNGVRLQSIDLVRKILKYELEDIEIILEAVLRYETYPQMLQQIMAYLHKVQSQQQAFPIHLAFYRNNWKLFTTQQFAHMVSYVTQHIQSKQQNFSQSYQFWHDLMISHQEGNLGPQNLAIFQNGIVLLWRLICIRCLLVQLPNHKKVSQLSLSIDVDEPQQDINLQQPLNCNKSAEHFRDLAGDFLNVCLKTFGVQSPFIIHMNNNLQALANSTLLDLQLAIYIICTICEVMPLVSKQSKGAVIAILRRQNDLNEYMCGRVIDLIAKLTNLFQQSPDILVPCLAFLSKCLRYDSLAPLAYQSCCELLQQSRAQSSMFFTEGLQAFLNHLYEILFSQTLTQRSRSNLAKSMVIFIHKFKNTTAQYLDYLTNYSSKISSMDTQNRVKFIDAAISAHFWINVHDQVKHRGAFQWFLNQQAPFLLQNIEAAQNKNQLTQRVNLVNLAFKTYAVSYIDTWIHVVNSILTKFIRVESPLPIALSPLINLAKAALHLENHIITSKVAQLLQFWAPNIVQLLGDITKPKLQFNVSNMVVQVHLVLLQIYYQRRELIQQQKYETNRLVIFIFCLFNKNDIWEYELYKNCLAYLTLLIKLGYPSQEILTTIFRSYRKFADTLWKSVEPILLQTFKQQGSTPILKALEQVDSPLDASNPLTAVLIDSFHKGQTKTIKNILLSLS